jgi:hypothetical protein
LLLAIFFISFSLSLSHLFSISLHLALIKTGEEQQQQQYKCYLFFVLFCLFADSCGCDTNLFIYIFYQKKKKNIDKKLFI